MDSVIADDSKTGVASVGAYCYSNYALSQIISYRERGFYLLSQATDAALNYTVHQKTTAMHLGCHCLAQKSAYQQPDARCRLSFHQWCWGHD